MTAFFQIDAKNLSHVRFNIKRTWEILFFSVTEHRKISFFANVCVRLIIAKKSRGLDKLCNKEV